MKLERPGFQIINPSIMGRFKYKATFDRTFDLVVPAIEVELKFYAIYLRMRP